MNRLIRSLCLACAGLFAAGLAQAETLRIGGKTFTEQRILTAITAQFLQKRGYDVTVTTGLGSTLARAAQENSAQRWASPDTGASGTATPLSMAPLQSSSRPLSQISTTGVTSPVQAPHAVPASLQVCVPSLQVPTLRVSGSSV